MPPFVCADMRLELTLSIDDGVRLWGRQRIDSPKQKHTFAIAQRRFSMYRETPKGSACKLNTQLHTKYKKF